MPCRERTPILDAHSTGVSKNPPAGAYQPYLDSRGFAYWQTGMVFADFITTSEGAIGDLLDELFFTDYAPIVEPDAVGFLLDLVVFREPVQLSLHTTIAPPAVW